MKKILYIEPDAALRKQVADTLKQVGYEVSDFSEPSTAVSAARSQRFDLLISEYILPGMKGTMLIREIFEIQLVPVILMSHHPSDIMDDTVNRLPILPRLLKKPFEMWELTDQIEEILHS